MAPEYRAVPVLVGRQVLAYPEPLPFWCMPKLTTKAVEGETMRTAYTNNVRFAIELVQTGLRFNERLGLMGGDAQPIRDLASMRARRADLNEVWRDGGRATRQRRRAKRSFHRYLGSV